MGFSHHKYLHFSFSSKYCTTNEFYFGFHVFVWATHHTPQITSFAHIRTMLQLTECHPPTCMERPTWTPEQPRMDSYPYKRHSSHTQRQSRRLLVSSTSTKTQSLPPQPLLTRAWADMTHIIRRDPQQLLQVGFYATYLRSSSLTLFYFILANAAAGGYITPYTYAALPQTGASTTGAYPGLTQYQGTGGASLQEARLQ